jgi:uncharacterized delta-60 repeat protein
MPFRPLVLAASCVILSTAQAADYDTDSSFGAGGWRRLYQSGGGTQNEKSVGFARTSDGGYVVVAELPGGIAAGGTGKRIGLFRLDRDGNYVASGFGTNGKVYKDAWLTSVTAMTIDAQGRIVVVGATPGPGNLDDFGVVRFNPDGSDDTSFAGDGGISFGFDSTASVNSGDAPTSVLAEADGKIVVAGNVLYTGATNRFGVVRLNVDGTVDSTFGSIDDDHGGRRGSTDTFGTGHAAYASQIVRIDGGYFVITGTTVISGTDTDFGARILTPEGSPWAGFAGSIELAVDEPGPGGSLYDTVTASAVVDPTTVLLAGVTSGKSAALRLVASKNGIGQYAALNLDASFAGSTNSVYSHRFVGSFAEDHVAAAAVRDDGRIVLAGRFAASGGVQYGIVTRLDADGSPDESFGEFGGRMFSAPTSGGGASYYSEFNGVLFDRDRMVLAGSSVDSTAAVSDFDAVITRMQSDLIFADGFETAP